MRTGHRDPRSLKSYQNISGDIKRNQQRGIILGDASGALDGTKDDEDGFNGIKHEDCGHGDETVLNVGVNDTQSKMVNKDEDGNGNDYMRYRKPDTHGAETATGLYFGAVQSKDADHGSANTSGVDAVAIDPVVDSGRGAVGGVVHMGGTGRSEGSGVLLPLRLDRMWMIFSTAPDPLSERFQVAR